MVGNLFRKYDPHFRYNIKSGPKNASYTSNKTQYNILGHAATMSSIVHCFQGRKISLICDKTSYYGHHEQLSVVVRQLRNVKNRSADVFDSIAERLKNLNSDSVYSRL